jgi:hypothetical protein
MNATRFARLSVVFAILFFSAAVGTRLAEAQTPSATRDLQTEVCDPSSARHEPLLTSEQIAELQRQFENPNPASDLLLDPKFQKGIVDQLHADGYHFGTEPKPWYENVRKFIRPFYLLITAITGYQAYRAAKKAKAAAAATAQTTPRPMSRPAGVR